MNAVEMVIERDDSKYFCSIFLTERLFSVECIRAQNITMA